MRPTKARNYISFFCNCSWDCRNFILQNSKHIFKKKKLRPTKTLNCLPPVTISSCNRLQKINEIYLKNLEKKQNRKNIFGFGCEGYVSARGEQSLNTSMDQKYWSQILVNVYRQSRTSVEKLFWPNKWFYNDQLRARKCNWRPRKKGNSQPWTSWQNIFLLFKNCDCRREVQTFEMNFTLNIRYQYK